MRLESGSNMFWKNIFSAINGVAEERDRYVVKNCREDSKNQCLREENEKLRDELSKLDYEVDKEWEQVKALKMKREVIFHEWLEAYSRRKNKIYYQINEMFKDIALNAMSANNKYNGKHLDIVGIVENINSNGDYIDISNGQKKSNLLDVVIRCYTKSDAQKQTLLEIKKGDSIKLVGKCTDVSETTGYSIDIEELSICNLDF